MVKILKFYHCCQIGRAINKDINDFYDVPENGQQLIACLHGWHSGGVL